jgi:hypothetical protein
MLKNVRSNLNPPSRRKGSDLDKGYNHDDYLQSHGYNIIEETVYYPGSWRIETNREDLLIDN